MADIVRVDLSTESRLKYKFFPASSGSVQFKVRAPEEAHIALTSGPYESYPMYEVFLGRSYNRISVIMKNRTKPAQVEETPHILNADEFRGFWVRWDGGVVSAGREGEAIPIISWLDPKLFLIRFVGVCTRRGATGTWKIEVSPISVTQNLKYFDDGLPEWKEYTDQLPPGAAIGGFEKEPLYLIRARHQGAATPGKFVPSEGTAYISWGGQAHAKEDFEALCGYNFRWVATSKGRLPPGAVAGGPADVGNEVMFIGRAWHQNYLIPGKVHVSHKVCYVPFEGQEIAKSEYEVLVTDKCHSKHTTTSRLTLPWLTPYGDSNTTHEDTQRHPGAR